MSFRFIQWNDLHLRPARRKASYPNLIESPARAAWLLEQLEAEVADEGVDFVLSVGDLIDGGVKDLTGDFKALRQDLITPMSVPLIPCAGNHERMVHEHRLAEPVAYDACFGQGFRQYYFTAGEYAFIVLDTSGAAVEDEEEQKARVAFLKQALHQCKGYQVIIVSHVPLYPIRNPEILARSFGMTHWRMPESELHEVLEAAADQIILILSGHVHLTGLVEVNGLRQFVMGGTAGCPVDYAIHQLDATGIQTNVIAADASLRDVNGVHGRPRHTVDYTDEAHPEHEDYLMGNPSERSFFTPAKSLFKTEKGVVNPPPVIEDVIARLP